MKIETRTCPICNKKFKAKITNNKKYCCIKCYRKSYVGKSYEERFGLKKANELKQKQREIRMGRKHSKETKTKISKSNKNKIFSQKHCDNISYAKKGKISHRKGLTQVQEYGYKKAKEISNKLRINRQGKTYKELYGYKKAKEISNKLGKIQKIIQSRPEVSLKKRQAALKRIEKNYGITKPNYNPKACEFFKSFDELNNTKGRYAVYGDGEYLIKDIVRWPDYINFDLKLIIEIDENHHFDKFGNLLKEDVQRQKEIQEFYPDFRFLRFKEKEMSKILEIKTEVNV